MPVDGVSYDVRPHADGRVGVALDGGRVLGDQADYALGDGVEVVVVRRADGVVQLSFGPKVPEDRRHELAFAVGVDRAHLWARQSAPIGVDWRADGGIERCHEPLDGRSGLGFEFNDVVEDVARVFIDGEHDVAIPPLAQDHLLDVDVQKPRLGCGS